MKHYQYPTTARAYGDEVVRLAPKVILWSFFVIVALPILLGLLVLGVLIVL